MDDSSATFDLRDAVYGSLIGGAIGDALGAPVECLQYHEIRERHGGRLERLIPSPIGNQHGAGDQAVAGMFTDDTTVRHYLCLAIIEKGGRITPDDWARTFYERANTDRLWLTEKIAHIKLQAGLSPWDTGRAAIPCGAATMAIQPVGIINAGDPRQAYSDAFLIASVNQDGVERDAAATTAAGIAAALVPGATVQSVVETMAEHSSEVVRRSIVFAQEFASQSSSMDEFAEKFYARLLDWKWPLPKDAWFEWSTDFHFSATSLEILPAVVGILLLEDDVNEAIIEGANFGRDCDTIGSVVGAFMGALYGARALRREWIETCEEATADFFEEVENDRTAGFAHTADRLIGALRQDLSRQSEHSQRWLGLVNEATQSNTGR